MDIDKIFEENGILKKFNDNYKRRPSQVEGAKLLYKSLKENKHFLLEGPCGFGKSLSYLIPAIQKLIDDNYNGKIVIATSNISLQEQLLSKDIPFVLDVFKDIYSNADMYKLLNPKTLKGIPNFLCKDKLNNENFYSNRTFVNKNDFDKIESFYKQTKDGDLTKVNFDISDEVKRYSTIESSQCKSSLCKYKMTCFYKQHKRDAIKSKIIVTNYSMLFTCLTTGSIELEDTSILILDEAHEVEKILRQFSAEKISYNSIIYIENKLTEIYNKSLECDIEISHFDTVLLREYAKEYFYQIECKYKKNSQEKVQIITGVKDLPDADNLVIMLNKIIQHLNDINLKVNVILSDYDGLEKTIEELIDLPIKKDIASSINKLIYTIKSYIHMIYEVDLILLDENMVMWLEKENNIIYLCKENIDISQLFLDLCLEPKYSKNPRTCILTSATLSVNGNFEYQKHKLGLDKIKRNKVKEYIGASPFNLSKQQLWYVPKNAVSGDSKFFDSSIKNQIVDIIKSTNGGALCLFTSKNNLNVCKEYLNENLLSYNILCQYEKPRIKLLEDFKKNQNSTLLACKSFFTGVDIPGKSLRCIIIDKLPFSSPGDPVNKKRSLQKNDFIENILPDMIITLKQGVGRGVRAIDDKCVICILDERFVSATYRKNIYSSFEYDMSITRDISDIPIFLEEGNCDTMKNNIFGIFKKMKITSSNNTLDIVKNLSQDYESMGVVELGNTRDKEAIKYIKKYLISQEHNDRRLAASAINKLSKYYKKECSCYKDILLENLNTNRPQVRQYTLKALINMELDDNDLNYLEELARKESKHYNIKLYDRLLCSRVDKEYNEA